jgi:KipI family sensor histidine kinase inhibitor
VLPVGDAAVTVQLGDRLDPDVNARVRAIDRALLAMPFDGFLESVPTLRSLLVRYSPSAVSFAAVEKALLALAGSGAGPPPPARTHEVPVVYGGEDGPDLPAVAHERGLSEAEVASLHTGTAYTVFMLGFTPGFGYLGLAPPALDQPRRATPRVRVPAGSVALAGRLTGVYPAASPGGWALLGRTARRLFDPHRAQPALLAPGDLVRFQAVPELPAPDEPLPVAPPSIGTAVEVRDGGLLTTVQDQGRAGHRRSGVSGAGPMDHRAHAAANRAVGNPEGAAALECTVSGPTLVFHAPVWIALAGADLGAVLERADLGSWPMPLGPAVLARPGNVLRFTGRRAGCRATHALGGGIDVPLVLGSRSTALQAEFGGLGGRKLAEGDWLRLGPAPGRPGDPAPTAGAAGRSVTVRVVAGPQADLFPPASRERFLAEPWRLGPTSDRVGCRLEGPVLAHSGRGEILSDGMVPGSVQVPPDGQPIVMMADAPTTGGYPKIATVVSSDLAALAQLVPGEGEVRFEEVTVQEAQE